MSPPPPTESSESYPTIELAITIVTYYSWPVIFGIGVLGDIASLLISLQKHNRRISTCIYVGALAFADTLCVVNALCLFTVTFYFFDEVQSKEFALL